MAHKNDETSPFRFASNKREKLVLSSFVGVLIFFILAVFEPFELGQYSTPYIKAVCLGYAVNTMVIVYVFGRYIHEYMDKVLPFRRWGLTYNTIHVLTPILCNGVINGFYSSVAFGESSIAPGFWKVIWYTILVGIIPTLLVLIWNYTIYLEKRNSRLQPSLIQNADETEGASITIKSPVTSDSLTVEVSKIILASSMGNYVSLFYLNGSEVERHTSRKTISSLSQELPCDNFIRCHRSHLVNMNFVLKKEGNAKGLKLTLNHIEDKVQVSRQYVPIVRQWYSDNASADSSVIDRKVRLEKS